MQLVVLGLNHKTAPVGIRECFSFSEEQVRIALRHINKADDIHEGVILSTCNRTEIYAVVDDPEEALAVLLDFFSDLSSETDQAEEYFFYHCGEACIKHLFRVAASLDSLVIGEGQILSQVKKAYAVAKDIGATSTVLNTLFHRAIAVGKRVRTETRIAYSAVSVSYAAVELAKSVLGDLTNINVLLLGAGQMGELTAKHLVDSGVANVFVSNRKYEKAVALAEKINGKPVIFENFMKSALETDIVITSTGAPHYIVNAWDTASLMKKRKGKSIIFIDIAVPRDIDPDVNSLDNVYLYDIDDLKEVVEENLATRRDEAAKATEIVNEEVAYFSKWLASLDMQPTIVDLIKKSQAIAEEELAKTLKRLGPVDDSTRDALEAMASSLVRKLNHDPIMFLKHGGMSQEGNGPRISVMRRIFNLDKTGCIYSEEN